MLPLDAWVVIRVRAEPAHASRDPICLQQHPVAGIQPQGSHLLHAPAAPGRLQQVLDGMYTVMTPVWATSCSASSQLGSTHAAGRQQGLSRSTLACCAALE